MNCIGRLVSGARRYCRDLNGTNLSGANDVIVVEQENGDYLSTPFHTCFGKMGLIRPKENLVSPISPSYYP
ncbi:unnamed protein product [Protopolystoma xenopodis]|uniref:Lipin N-terminal domain-containing protein n=1 Tax=Protopolystoma xenopodis TaxID=117903 RepID=A0A448X3U9_9PLAT|nr:unnamed protein product [Protopolystoma xenopodis]